MSATRELYKFRKTGKNYDVYTREQAIQHIVSNWGSKYGTTAEDAGEQLDQGTSDDFMRIRKRCPRGTRLNKMSGNCQRPSVSNSASRRQKRCPRGTRRNKATGLCTAK